MTEATALRGGTHLHFTGNALPQFGRYIFAFLGCVLVVPAPWMAAWFWRLFVDNTEAEDGTQISFEGQGAEIWLPLMVLALMGAWSGFVPWPQNLEMMSPVILVPLNIFLYLLVTRWLVTSLRLNGGRVSFVGSSWPYLGYFLLYFVSLFTIIGWAWVLAAWLRWQSSMVVGDVVVSFAGKGHEILWRGLLALLGFLLVIPIPWMMTWSTKWFVNQISIAPASGQSAADLIQIEFPADTPVSPSRTL